MEDKMAAVKHYNLAVTQPLIQIDTNRITKSKMADKMAAVQMHGCISSVYIYFKWYSLLHFAVCQLLCGLSCMNYNDLDINNITRLMLCIQSVN